MIGGRNARLMENVYEYDVIVVGGGTAGATAGIAAAEQGMNTLIIEKNSYLGGTASGAQVTPMMSTGTDDCSYVNIMIKEKLEALKQGTGDPYGNDGWFNPEALKFLLEELYVERGGKILYDTEFIDSHVENNRISEITVHNRGGVMNLRSKIIIDCSGDAIVAESSGIKCFKGNEKDGKNQAISLRFMLGNIDIKGFCHYLKHIEEPLALEYPLLEIVALESLNNPFSRIFKKAVIDKLLEKEDLKYIQAFSVPGMENVMSFNCPEIPNVEDALNPFLVSEGIITGRKMIKRLYLFLKSNIPGFENSFILSIAPMIGIRESRRIKGKYIITEKDYSNRAEFRDAIARTAYPVDVHGFDLSKEEELRPMEKGEYFEIPFRSLVPEKIDNLLVAGRCISSSFIAQSAIRIQPTCRATGEAAGVGAAYCVNNNINTGDIDGSKIRKIMIDKGARL
jgi:hypothetical protein